MNTMSQTDAWDRVAEGYNGSTRAFLATFSEAALAPVVLTSETEVLDVACGPGTTALMLADRVARVKAIDFAPQMIDTLRANAARLGIDNVDARVGDGQALPYEDDRFDLAVSMFGVIFFPDPARGLRELHRTLAPGGRAIVSSWAPIERSPMVRTMLEALTAAAPPAPSDRGAKPGLPFTDPSELAEAMGAAGFRDVTVEPQRRAQEVTDVAAFWRDWAVGSAPIQHMKAQLGDGEWARREAIAVAHLERSLGELPASLSSLAYVATGHKRS